MITSSYYLFIYSFKTTRYPNSIKEGLAAQMHAIARKSCELGKVGGSQIHNGGELTHILSHCAPHASYLCLSKQRFSKDGLNRNERWIGYNGITGEQKRVQIKSSKPLILEILYIQLMSVKL